MKNGFYVVYKTHPDRKKEIEGIFDKSCDLIIHENFEKVWNIAESLIFTYTSTTCFGFAINTDKKIILLDQGIPWSKNYNKDIIKNVKIVNKNNDNMAFKFNELEIVSSLNSLI